MEWDDSGFRKGKRAPPVSRREAENARTVEGWADSMHPGNRPQRNENPFTL